MTTPIHRLARLVGDITDAFADLLCGDPCDRDDAARALLAEAEAEREVFEPLRVPESAVGFYDCPCGSELEIFPDDPTSRLARVGEWIAAHQDCGLYGYDQQSSAAAVTPPSAAERPDPATPSAGSGQPTSGAACLSPHDARRTGAAAPDQPTSDLLTAAANQLGNYERYLISPDYLRELILALRARAAIFADIEDN